MSGPILIQKGFVGVVMDDKSTPSANTTEVAGKATEKLRPHLLIVDDDRELCEILKRYLETEDFRVSFVHTGDAGAKAGIEGGFELIVLDVMLPDKKGFSVLKDIRQRARTPVLMLTARGEEFDRSQNSHCPSVQCRRGCTCRYRPPGRGSLRRSNSYRRCSPRRWRSFLCPVRTCCRSRRRCRRGTWRRQRTAR